MLLNPGRHTENSSFHHQIKLHLELLSNVLKAAMLGLDTNVINENVLSFVSAQYVA